jgi:NitT/TauT family transport system substrate-binding protein
MKPVALCLMVSVRLLAMLCGVSVAAVLVGCGDADDKPWNEAAGDRELEPVRFQLNWRPQPERGGFYHALVSGYYAEEGLDVEILAGGPTASVGPKVGSGQVEFGDFRLEKLIELVDSGIPLVGVAAYMQHDPQGIMVHADSGIEDFADLEGHTVMSVPGTAFIEVIKLRYGIDFQTVPMDYGLARFINDPELARQNFITSEPFYVSEAGHESRTLLIADAGFDLYRVIGVRRDFAEEHPELVRGFVRASLRGWKEYMEGQREKADARLRAVNPELEPAMMDYSYAMMHEYALIDGRANQGIGHIDLERIEGVIADLEAIDFLENDLEASDLVRLDFLPEELPTISEPQERTQVSQTP